MRTTLCVALDIAREALARRWFLAFALALTALHLVLLCGLRLDVVDGALAATRLFGSSLSADIRPVDVVLRHVFEAATYGVFYAGLAFGVLACSDFGPELLAPGRIEHLLSLPVRRVELLAGTFIGVLALGLVCTTYGAGGFFLILCAKGRVLSWRPFCAVYLSSVAFFALYACMLTTAVLVRSAAASAAAGGVTFLLGVLAGRREELAALVEPGLGRQLFLAVSAPLPRIAELADAAASLALGEPPAVGLGRLVLGTLVFGLSVLGVGAYALEGKDF
jgi:ABC-2 type transport system permease protein